jgi:hypothetical protein
VYPERIGGLVTKLIEILARMRAIYDARSRRLNIRRVIAEEGWWPYVCRGVIDSGTRCKGQGEIDRALSSNLYAREHERVSDIGCGSAAHGARVIRACERMDNLILGDSENSMARTKL